MSYRVVYKPTTKHKNRLRSSGTRIFFLTFLFGCIFVYGVNFYWQEGREVLRKLLWPQTTQQAVQVFIKDLQTGYPVLDAIEGFCREIIQRAG